MKSFLRLILNALAASGVLLAQVPTIPDSSQFKDTQTNINTALTYIDAHKVDIGTAYSDPTWITHLDWSKLLNVPSFSYQGVKLNGGSTFTPRPIFNFTNGFGVTDDNTNGRTVISCLIASGGSAGCISPSVLWSDIGGTPASVTTVTLNTSDNVSTVVAGGTAGTKYTFAPGTTGSPNIFLIGANISPHNGDTFTTTGALGTVVLKGSTTLTGSALSGGLYQYTGKTPVGSTGGTCESGHALCSNPQDLYFDSVPLVPVASTGAVITGTWYWDRTAHIIYIFDNPSGHTVELSVTSTAISSSATGVTVSGLVVEKFAGPAGQSAAIYAQGAGWVITNNEVRLNHSGGINAFDSSNIQGNLAHDNGNKGIGGIGANILVVGNTVYNNNYAHFEPTWEAGGIKISATTNLIIRKNYSHDNYGQGIWNDQHSVGTLIEHNRSENNSPGEGIKEEIGSGCTIRNNTTAGNHLPTLTFLWGSQILIQNSQNCDVYDNTADVTVAGGNGISIIQQDRTADTGPWGNPLARNNKFYNNTVIIRGGLSSNSGLIQTYDPDGLVATANSFDSNYYHLQDVISGVHFDWSTTAYTFSAFKAVAEAHGNADTVMPLAAFTDPTTTVATYPSDPSLSSIAGSDGINGLPAKANANFSLLGGTKLGPYSLWGNPDVRVGWNDIYNKPPAFPVVPHALNHAIGAPDEFRPNIRQVDGTGAVSLASLGGCSTANEGTIRPVFDASTNVWGMTATGGSSHHATVQCDSGSWKVMGGDGALGLTVSHSFGSPTLSGNALTIPDRFDMSQITGSFAFDAATLPTCNTSTEGTIRAVFNASTNLWGQTATGSGSHHATLFCDSGSWKVMGGDGALSITTTGSSGPATFSGGVLNIPQYVGSGGGNMNTSTYDVAGVAGQVLKDSGSNGLLKRTAAGITAAATAGTDYYAPGGSITSTDLPNPGASAGGKVRSLTCSAGNHVSAINTDSSVTCSADTGSGASFAYHAYTGTSVTTDFSTYTDVLVTASNNVTITATAPSVSGTPLYIGLCNPSTAYTWTLPSTFKRVGTPSVASTCAYTPITWDGTNYQGPGSDETPSILRFTAERADPGSGNCLLGGCQFIDSTAHAPRHRNSSDVLFGMVKVSQDINTDTGAVIKVNGGSVPTSAKVMGSNGSAQPVAATAADVSSMSYAAGGGTANAQTVTLSPAIASLATGVTVRWKPSNANTGAATLAVSGLTATSITKCGTTALASGDLTTAAVAVATYDGTQFQLQNPQAAACSGGAPSGSAGGDLSGTYPNPTVAKINGTALSGLATGILKNTTSTGVPSIATYADLPAVALPTPGTSITLAAPGGYAVCTSTCTVTIPVPAAGYQFCVRNGNNVSTVITLAAIGSSARYENTASTAYGTAGTGTFVSGGAAGDKVCVVGLDSTHYMTMSFNGSWTAN